MKKSKIVFATLLVISSLLPGILNAQQRKKALHDSKIAKTAFIRTDASMQKLFDNSYAYVIFPSVGKGAVIVGAGGGNGIVFEKGKAIGTSSMFQASVGAQIGGQAFREVIFLENKEALDRFKDNKLEFTGEVSAVAAKSGASLNAKYNNGVTIFTEGKNGLMAEAAVGGQKFKYKSF